MAIKDKDQKILWGRAAGRCSFLECKEKLTLDKENKGSATLGAMCHIVGGKEKSPRGTSILTEAERNSYSNLILLCSHHHDVIDTDCDSYPVETLHLIKAEHELWVDETLGNTGPDPDELVYSDLIDTVTEGLKLNSWLWFIDGAVRDTVHEHFFEVRGYFNAKLIGSIWPLSNQELGDAIRAVISSFDTYLGHFSQNMEKNGEFFKRDRSFARFWNPQYSKYAEREDKWSQINFSLLCDFVVKLNHFADMVRMYSNPLFFRTEGKFLIYDEMGYRSGGEGTVFLPSEEFVQSLQSHLA